MSELGLTASHREIGATVARLFQDVRGETKRAIETKLGRASVATLRAVTESGETRVLRPPGAAPRRARRRLALFVVIGGMTLMAVAALAAWQTGAFTRPANPGASAPPLAADRGAHPGRADAGDRRPT